MWEVGDIYRRMVILGEDSAMWEDGDIYRRMVTQGEGM